MDLMNIALKFRRSVFMKYSLKSKLPYNRVICDSNTAVSNSILISKTLQSVYNYKC